MFNSLSASQTAEHYENSARARSLALFTICLGGMLGPMSLSAVNIALPSIAEDLNADAVMVAWIPTSYLLAVLMVMLPMGKAADMYGRKKFFFIGAILAATFSIAVSFSQHVTQLIVLRMLQAASMAMIMSSGMAMLTAIFPKHKRGSAMGIYSACLFASLTMSPLLGGWVTEMFGWRAVFWMAAPISLAIAISVLLGMKGEWRNPDKQTFDWTGALIFACWGASFVYGLSGLPKLSSLVTLGLSLLYMALFIYHQKRVAHPLVRLDMFGKNRQFSFSAISVILIACANYPTAFLLSLFIQISMGYTPAQAGQVLFIQALVIAVASPFTGRLSDKIQPRYLSTTGCCFLALGYFLISRVTPGMGAGGLLAGQLCLGLGYGIFATPNANAALSAIKQNEMGVATASIALSRTLGNMTGITLVGLLIYNLIGPTEFTPALSDELTYTVHFWVYVSIALTLSAGIFSFYGGRGARSKTQKADELPAAEDA